MRALKTLLLVLLVMPPALGLVPTAQAQVGKGKWNKKCMDQVQWVYEPAIATRQSQLDRCVEYARKNQAAGHNFSDRRIILQFCEPHYLLVQEEKIMAHKEINTCKGGEDGYCTGYGCKKKPK